MLKRTIYKLLSVLYIIFIIYISIFNESGFPAIATLIILLLSSILLWLITGIFLTLSKKVESPINFIPFMFGLLTFNRKKIKHKEYGYHWLIKFDGNIFISKQGFFALYVISEFHYNDQGIEFISERIKENLDNYYLDKLYNKKNSNSYKNWDGNIDKREESEIDILNKNWKNK